MIHGSLTCLAPGRASLAVIPTGLHVLSFKNRLQFFELSSINKLDQLNILDDRLWFWKFSDHLDLSSSSARTLPFLLLKRKVFLFLL